MYKKSGRMKVPLVLLKQGKRLEMRLLPDNLFSYAWIWTNGNAFCASRRWNEALWILKEARLKWHLSLGLGKENYRFHDHEKLAHYKCSCRYWI
jgi:glycyl-tRNA synthetase